MSWITDNTAMFVMAIAGIYVVSLLFQRIDELQKDVRKANAATARALELIAELHARPEAECEMAQQARQHRREMAELGIISKY